MAASRAARPGRATRSTSLFGPILADRRGGNARVLSAELLRTESYSMAFITTIDVLGLTPTEYRAILDQMGVEKNPEPGLYLHLTARIEGGYRITEVWDTS